MKVVSRIPDLFQQEHSTEHTIIKCTRVKLLYYYKSIVNTMNFTLNRVCAWVT